MAIVGWIVMGTLVGLVANRVVPGGLSDGGLDSRRASTGVRDRKGRTHRDGAMAWLVETNAIRGASLAAAVGGRLRSTAGAGIAQRRSAQRYPRTMQRVPDGSSRATARFVTRSSMTPKDKVT
jgi:hypothetical protein